MSGAHQAQPGQYGCVLCEWFGEDATQHPHECTGYLGLKHASADQYQRESYRLNRDGEKSNQGVRDEKELEAAMKVGSPEWLFAMMKGKRL